MRRYSDHRFLTAFARGLSLALVVTAFSLAVSAQLPGATPAPFGSGRNNQNDQPKNVKEYLAKQRAAKAKKDHEELLSRGDQVLFLATQLEAAYDRNKQLSLSDREKLESVEKLVERIRRSLGGDDDDGEVQDDSPNDAATPPETVEDAVVGLKDTVLRLVDELKKTTRFTISAAAIQSSNSVLKLVRFLRLRR